MATRQTKSPPAQPHPTIQAMIDGYGPNFPSLEELFALEPDEAEIVRLSAPTPHMGRYLKEVGFLCDVTSQRQVGLQRFLVMIEWFITVSDTLSAYNGIYKNHKITRRLTVADKKALRALVTNADVTRAEWIERFTEHDTAAAGDWLKFLIAKRLPHLAPYIEGVNFANTSEDTMSPTMGRIANKLVFGHFVPRVLQFMTRFLDYVEWVERDGPLVVPALTHQQAAEPTTFGKKIVTTLSAIEYHIARMSDASGFIPFTGRVGGAVGNLATHYAAYPDIPWRQVAHDYIVNLGLRYDEMTFQSSLYAVEASHLTELANMLTHIIKFADDFLRLASCPGQLFVKRRRKGAKGSSVMPGKSNAWGTEGAIRMLREACTLLRNLAVELPSFPHEGDMGRSYLMRNIASAFMPAFIALGRIENEIVGDLETRGYVPHPGNIAAFFEKYPGMGGSLMQTVLKQLRVPGDPYRDIQAISLNPDGSVADSQQFAEGLETVMQRYGLANDAKSRLRCLLRPDNCTGDAEGMTFDGIVRLRHLISVHRQRLAIYNP